MSEGAARRFIADQGTGGIGMKSVGVAVASMIAQCLMSPLVAVGQDEAGYLEVSVGGQAYYESGQKNGPGFELAAARRSSESAVWAFGAAFVVPVEDRACVCPCEGAPGRHLGALSVFVEPRSMYGSDPAERSGFVGLRLAYEMISRSGLPYHGFGIALTGGKDLWAGDALSLFVKGQAGYKRTGARGDHILGGAGVAALAGLRFGF